MRQPGRKTSPQRKFTVFKTRSGSDDEEGTQVFSTEFISAMYMDDSEPLRDYKIISDTWRQKYNDPIQVPSGAFSRITRSEPV